MHEPSPKVVVYVLSPCHKGVFAINVIVYDFGTSNLKTCLFNIDSEVRVVATSSAAYNLYVLKNGGAEQDVEEWWQAVCSSTKEVLCRASVAPEHIAGLAFCSQMQGVLSGKRGYFNYYAELETAGKCFEWVTNHIALDEIGVYLDRATVADDAEGRFANLYDYLSDEVSKTPLGANGVIFTPWLHGNRCPFEDTAAAGMFFNLRLETGKRDMIRAVVEGVCYHLRWLLECESRTAKISDPVRFVGGGTRSSVGTQILADILGHTVEVVEGAREAGPRAPHSWLLRESEASTCWSSRSSS